MEYGDEKMNIRNKTSITGLIDYLNYLSVGDTSRVIVEISWKNGYKWSGRAWERLIRIYIPHNMSFPFNIKDRYMSRYKSLETISKNPHTANNVQDVIGFLFLHELAHVKASRTRRNKRFIGEWRCTKWAYDNWKPCPQEFIERGEAKAKVKSEQRERSLEKTLEVKAQRKTLEHKLVVVKQRITSWETKRKRADTYLKKLQRRERLYHTIMTKQSLNAP